jgi:hypothetical protein
MSTSAEIQAIRRQEQRYPADLSRDYRSYVRATVVRSETVRRLREMRAKRTKASM